MPRRVLFVLPVIFILLSAIYIGAVSEDAVPAVKLICLMVALLAFGVSFVYLAWNLEVLIHELGHWVAAKLMRIPVKALMVHRVTVKSESGKLRWSYHQPQSWASGAVLIGTFNNPTPLRIAILYGAGPAASLLMAAAFLFAWTRVQANHPAAVALMLFAILSGITVSHSLSGTDGMMLKSIFRRDGLAVHYTELHNLYLEMHDMRPRDYPMDRIDALHADPQYKPYALTHHFYYLMDRGEIEAAERPLTEAWERLAEITDPNLRVSILKEAAMYFVRFLNVPEIAESAFEMLPAANPDEAQRNVVLATRSWRDGDIVAAENAMAIARAEFAAMKLSPDMRDHVKEWLDRILDPSIPIRKPADQVPAPSEPPI